MAVEGNAKGTLWVDGRFTARVRAPGPSPARIFRFSRPFARVGSHPDAEIRIPGPAVEPVHALLVLDRRGVFGVDLLSRSGTRFAGAEGGSAWLGAGDILEVAGHRIELFRLLVAGRAIDPPLCGDDPLATATGGDLAAVTLEPLDAPGPPWMLGSPLAFLGRAEGCAIRVEDASASRVHCAILRGPGGAHAIGLLGRPTLVGGRPIAGASALLDGDVLDIGRARFVARVGPADDNPAPGRDLARRDPGPSPDALIARLIDAIARDPSPPQGELIEAIRRLRSETVALLGDQIDRVDSLGREIAALREEIFAHHGPARPPALPLRLDLLRPSPNPPASDPASWLLDRFRGLEAEGRSTRADLAGRIASIAHPRLPAQPPAMTIRTLSKPPETPSR